MSSCQARAARLKYGRPIKVPLGLRIMACEYRDLATSWYSSSCFKHRELDNTGRSLLFDPQIHSFFPVFSFFLFHKSMHSFLKASCRTECVYTIRFVLRPCSLCCRCLFPSQQRLQTSPDHLTRQVLPPVVTYQATLSGLVTKTGAH